MSEEAIEIPEWIQEIVSQIEGFLAMKEIWGVSELKSALESNRDAVVKILWITEEQKNQLQFWLLIYQALKWITAEIEIQVWWNNTLSEEEQLRIAEEYIEANKDNQIIQLILARMKAGHILNKPFTIATGWDIKDCTIITQVVNIYLAHYEAWFRVHIVKGIPEDKKSLQ